MKNPIAIGPTGRTVIDLDRVCEIRFSAAFNELKVRYTATPQEVSEMHASQEDFDRIKFRLTHLKSSNGDREIQVGTLD